MKLICDDNNCPAPRPSQLQRGWTFANSLLVLFMPKCAICWTAYMSFLGSLGITIKYKPWFLPVLAVLFLLSLLKLLVTSVRRKEYIAPVLALIAACLVFSERTEPGLTQGKIFAIVLMALAMSLDNLKQLFRLLKLHKVV